MAGRRIPVLDVREMVRRLKLGQADREVARDLGTNRRTIARYRKIARTEGWLDRPDLPEPADIDRVLAALGPPSPHGPESSAEPHRARVIDLRRRDVEATAIWQILRQEAGFTKSYRSVLRFIRRLEPLTPEPCVRVETAPAQEVQVDFGYVGKRLDRATDRMRPAWVFVMTLSWSRHQYAEIVFDQKVDTWLALHVRAFEFFGGVPRRVVLDNLKAGIVRASMDDPEVQRSYLELAEHYGFLISPCRPRTPEHKGKVESGVHYVQRNALAGRDFASLEAENAHLRQWILTVAGTRDHGTTREPPLSRFEFEKAALLALPPSRYEPAVWKQAKLHPDCHVVFDKSYYSAPHRLIGRKLCVRATASRVEIYHEHERVASHSRATEAGERVSNVLHYPDTHLAGLLATPVRLREQARAIGEAAFRVVSEMLSDKPVDRLRSAQGIVGLAKRYPSARVEAACKRALACGTTSRRCITTILKEGLDKVPLPPEAVTSGRLPRTTAFVRPVHEIAQALL